MSVKKEPSGRRSVQVEVEVPGTPEQVWQAIASGPGISSWFVPSTVEGRVGGTTTCDFGGGMVSSSKITQWDPPRRFVAEGPSWVEGGPPIATEWIVEAKSGGTCVVRVVHSLFASTDDWDGQIESTEHGWPGYFRVLKHYLQHHAGEASAAFVLMAPVAAEGGASGNWQTFAKALGVPDAKIGQSLRVANAGRDLFRGSVQAVDHVPQGSGIMAVVQEPAPGVVMASAMDCMGMCMATLQAFFYGPRAAAAAAQQERWQQWLSSVFPPAIPPAG